MFFVTWAVTVFKFPFETRLPHNNSVHFNVHFFEGYPYIFRELGGHILLIRVCRIVDTSTVRSCLVFAHCIGDVVQPNEARDPCHSEQACTMRAVSDILCRQNKCPFFKVTVCSLSLVLCSRQSQQVCRFALHVYHNVEDGREAEAARGGDRWFVYRRH